MPSQKKTVNKPTPANKQRGKKRCTCCKEEKSLSRGFYVSKSPLFQIDGRLNICKTCIISMSLNEDGTINEVELNKILRKTDKPYYKDYLDSAYKQFLNENIHIDQDQLKYHGREVLQYYFKNLVMPQTINKGYDDSERDGFILKNSGSSKAVQKKIERKYEDINSISSNSKDGEERQDTSVKWTKKDKQNMKYVISTVGYDPFEDLELNESDRKYCFNVMAGYCDTDGIVEDGNKMRGVIEMTNMYCQCKNFTAAINAELSNPMVDEQRIQRLTNSKTSMLSAISTIARDNNIASNYNKNSKQGKNSLTSKMKELEKNDFEMIRVNLFDIKTSEAFKQISDLSNQSIMEQVTLDNNEYAGIVKEQREIIQKLETENMTLKEENRNLKNKLIDLESKR